VIGPRQLQPHLILRSKINAINEPAIDQGIMIRPSTPRPSTRAGIDSGAIIRMGQPLMSLPGDKN